jgi:hypothetical protein
MNDRIKEFKAEVGYPSSALDQRASGIIHKAIRHQPKYKRRSAILRFALPLLQRTLVHLPRQPIEINALPNAGRS